MLKLEDVHSYYGISHILQGVSMDINPKEIVCLLGRNGVGKTTTVKTIMGLVPPREGKIIFKDKDIAGRQPQDVAKLGIGYVPQGRRLFPNLTVYENLMLGMIAVKKAEATQKLGEVYSHFPILKERRNQMARTLSGGEQQMLAIGRALVGTNEFLILDEPSEGLALGLAKEFGKVLRELRARGSTILLVEQNATMALNIADRAYIMEKGKIVFEGTPKEVYESKQAMEKLGI